MSERRGFSAPEALVALVLGLFLVHLGLVTLVRVRAAERRLAARTDALVGMRVARHLLRRELGWGRAGVDWSPDADSISMRAFRGTALVCPGRAVPDELTVRFEGDRLPDPTKDSVIVVEPGGEGSIRRLVAATGATAPCGAIPASDLQLWRLDGAVPSDAVAARLFERGSYHIASSALRYRRGLSGRQPLTPEVWSSASGWTQAGGRFGVRAELLDSAAGRSWSTFLAWSP